MKNKGLAAILCGFALLSLTACSTSGDSGGTGTLVEDGTYQGQDQGYFQDEVVTGIDPNDGAVTIGDPNQQYRSGGPQQLRGNNTIYFGYDSDKIADPDIAILQEHARYLRGNPDARIIIEGHTDERGTPEYNIALGERRARSVARYMQNFGVDVNQLSIVSYGEEKPAVPGHNDQAWRQNRRAVINY